MNDTRIIVEILDFPCIPWEMAGGRINAVPGTWTLAPEYVWEQGVKGIICCPNRECHEACLIRYDMGSVINGVLELSALSCNKCGLLCNARLLEWDTRKLFCVAYELLHADGTVSLRKEYLHAEVGPEADIKRGRYEAIATFVAGTGYVLDHATPPQVWRLIDAGLAIGYFGQESDKDQINLSVD